MDPQSFRFNDQDIYNLSLISNLSFKAKAYVNNNEEQKCFDTQVSFSLRQKVRDIPHLAEAFDILGYTNKIISGESKNEECNFKSQFEGSLKRMDPNSKLGSSNSQIISNQAGISIREANYLNTKKRDNQEEELATWQKALRNGTQLNNQFGILAPNMNKEPKIGQNNSLNGQMPDLFQGVGSKRQYSQVEDNDRLNDLGNLYQPAFKVGSNNSDQNKKRDNKILDQYMQNYGNFQNLNRNTQDRLLKILDQNDEVEIKNITKPFEKNRMDFYEQQFSARQQQNNGGFVSGAQQFKMEMDRKKQNNNPYGGDDYYNGGSRWGAQANNNYNGYNPYNFNHQSQGYNQPQYGYNGYPPPPYGYQPPYNQRYEDDSSATDRFLNNSGRQPGIGGRRKFVPPTKDGKSGSGGGQSGSFHPGKSVMQHMLNGNEDKKDGDLEIVQDERYKNLDPRMVELIENEIMERQPNVTWDDIAGLEFAKKTINEIIIWPMLRPDLFKGIRAPPRGVLFFGPPGTGKTLLGKAISAQTKSTFMSISASTLTSKWVGEGEKMVRTMFAIAAIHQPTVVFIDEIDSLLCSRNENDMESSRRIKTEFLVQLDGANTFAGENARILIIGATNRPDDLDEAVRRRLVKRLYIPLPNKAGRNQFIERLIESESNDENQHHIDLDQKSISELVDLTKGYSGADLKSLSAEAAMIPLRQIDDIQNVQADKIRPIVLDDFKEALKNVKATVNQNDLNKFLEWNEKYGSFPITEEELKD